MCIEFSKKKSYNKIKKDGTVEEKTPDEYSYAKHGYSQILARGDGIEVKGVNEYFDSATKFFVKKNGEIRDIDERSDNEGLILKAATGGYMIYTIQQTVGGDRTVVKRFACYADGTGSINGDVILDTEVGTNIVKMSDKICACVM